MTEQNKYELIEKLVLTEDESVLQQVKAILDNAEIHSFDELNPKLKESIRIGIDQSNQGLGASHENVIRELRSRFKK